MKTPRSIGFDAARFPAWRKGQEKAIRRLLYDDSRFAAMVLPTGSGKSLTYMAYAAIDDGRACVLTSTKALQDQLMGDFEEALGMTDMRGRSNYVCDIDQRRTADDAICTAGSWCERMKVGPCGYYDQKREAREARIVVTNYSYWLNDMESSGLGPFSVVICDEAHRAPDEVGDFAAVEITERDLHEYGIERPDRKKGLARWGPVAVEALEAAVHEKAGYERTRRAMRLTRSVARLCRLSEQDWLFSKSEARGRRGRGTGIEKFRWDLIDPGALAEELLFRGASKVILSSASIRKKTLQLLDVERDISVMEQESTFPVRRRPIYYWPVVKMNRRTTGDEKQRWVDAIDEVVRARQDRKGILHCVSYDRGKEIVRLSGMRESGCWMLHERGTSTAEMVERFVRAKPPTVLVSPAIGEGLDFPGKLCEYVIVAKVPFPDLSSPLVRARSERDEDYVAYVTLQNLVQSVGRGMRSAEDQQESFIVDGAFGWLRYQHQEFMPRWFESAIKTVKKGERLPPPLPRLE